jgi:Dullard-like phosphatase family protein
MRTLKPQKSQNVLQGNILARSNKLTIEVPDEEESVVTEKFNKNSPTYSRVAQENIKPTNSPCPKPRTPASARNLKKANPESGTPVAAAKQKKFSFSPKVGKKVIVKPIQFIVKRHKAKNSTPVGKNSGTPTNRTNSREARNRPKTTNLEKKGMGKEENEAKPSLSSFVTSVKSAARSLPPADEANIREKSEMLYKEHLFQTFQALKFVKTLQPVDMDQLREKRVSVPRRKGYENKKTVIFDLDETLVHCCDENTLTKPMIMLPVVFPNGETVQAGINIRPYVLDCLREVNKYFEVFVFTASHPCYANVVLDFIDPKKELIHQRFYRDSCVSMGGVFIKDLRIFANRSLKDMIIIDNAAYSFAYQLDNGIPIVSWHDDLYDKELFNLIDYLKALANVNDIREANEKTFHLQSFYDDYINEFLSNEITSPKTSKKLS